MVVGWVASQFAIANLVNPDLQLARATRRYELEAARKPQQAVIFNVEHKDGYIARIAGNIPFEHWQAVSKIVVAWQSKNLTTMIVAKALPDLVQADQRAVHAQMCGLLETAGVILKKNNHNEITIPVGWSFFARVSNGMISPLQRFGVPHSPQRGSVSQNAGLHQHTPAPRANFSPVGE
jgi:hypothetical protein